MIEALKLAIEEYGPGVFVLVTLWLACAFACWGLVAGGSKRRVK